jgi:hypothetical protein
MMDEFSCQSNDSWILQRVKSKRAEEQGCRKKRIANRQKSTLSSLLASAIWSLVGYNRVIAIGRNKDANPQQDTAWPTA